VGEKEEKVLPFRPESPELKLKNGGGKRSTNYSVPELRKRNRGKRGPRGGTTIGTVTIRTSEKWC